MRIAVTGATGQMGSNMIDTAAKKNIMVSVAVARKKTKHKGLEVRNDDRFEELIRKNDVDVIIDFTAPKATMKYLKAAVNTDTPIIIGTTGFSDEEVNQIKNAGNHIPVIKASNFSPGINVMSLLLKMAATKLKDYDIEITEKHHNKKRDAPSGTAESFLEIIKKVQNGITVANGREGEAPRDNKELGVHSVRAGDIKGVHEVLLAGNEEVLKITHRSESREIFASGAIKAAKWIRDKDPGYYRFSKVLE